MSRFPDPMLSELLWVSTRFLETVRRANKRRALRSIEDQATKAIGKAFVAQGKAFVGKLATIQDQFPLQEAVSEADWGPLFDWAAKQTDALLQAAIRACAEAGLLEGANGLINDLGGLATGYSFDLQNAAAIAYLKAHGADLVRQINDTTRAEIRTLVTSGVEAGDSYGDIARAITARFKEFAAGQPQQHIDSRAHLVAVTEAGQAYEFGNFTASHELQDRIGPMEKSWGTMNDGHVSQGCRDNAQVGWIPLDQAFPSGHQHPLRFPGCRCDLFTRVKE